MIDNDDNDNDVNDSDLYVDDLLEGDSHATLWYELQNFYSQLV